MTTASDYHVARPAFQSMNEPSADLVRLLGWWIGPVVCSRSSGYGRGRMYLSSAREYSRAAIGIASTRHRHPGLPAPAAPWSPLQVHLWRSPGLPWCWLPVSPSRSIRRHFCVRIAL